MKLFAHENIKPASFIGNETFEELQEEIDDLSREAIAYVETYDNARAATSALTALDSMRITDRRVYDITMESINDQLGYPEDTRLTLEGLGTTIHNFGKKVWDKIVHAMRNFDVNVLKMFNIIGNFMRGTNDKAVIEVLSKSREECIKLVKTDNKKYLDKIGTEWDKAHAILDKPTWVASKDEVKNAFNVNAVDVARAIGEKATLDKPVNVITFTFTIKEGIVDVTDAEPESKKRSIKEYIEDSGNFMTLSNKALTFINRMSKEGEKKKPVVTDEITKIMKKVMSQTKLISTSIENYRKIISAARYIIVRIKNPDKKLKDKSLGRLSVMSSGI